MKRIPLLALALLAGCTTLQSDPTPDADPSAPSEAAPVRPGVAVSELVATGEGRAFALDRLGPPRRADAEPFENLHVPGQVDTLRTLHYDGLRVELYDVTGGRALLQSLTVTGEAYDTGLGFRVGATRPEVEAALGEPAERVEGAYEYLTGDPVGAENYLTVRFDGDRVRELVWSFYVD